MYNYFASGKEFKDMITSKFNPKQSFQYNRAQIEFLSPNYLYRNNVPKIGEGFRKESSEWLDTLEQFPFIPEVKPVVPTIQNEDVPTPIPESNNNDDYPNIENLELDISDMLNLIMHQDIEYIPKLKQIQSEDRPNIEQQKITFGNDEDQHEGNSSQSNL